MVERNGPKIGVQGSVLGWNDPFHPDLCRTVMRTGEGRVLGPQDPQPTVGTFMELLRSLGADLYLHHVMPDAAETDRFLDAVERFDIDFLLGNEYGNINGPYGDALNRYDVPDSCVAKAARSARFQGLLYDETEHLQLHPSMYLDYHPEEAARGRRRHQWANVDGLTLQESEDAVTAAVEARREAYGGNVEMYGEHVFPTMFHALARGGMNPCPKVLKEEFASAQLATALGAARQYGRKLGVCVDFWGQDVGTWFTRIWGFPGHSPAEYRSALELSYLFAPDLLFTENADVLARNTPRGFERTEFGDILHDFTHRFVPAHPLAHHHSQCDPDVVLIRSDDTEWGGEEHPYGNSALTFDYRSRTPFKAFHMLSRGSLPANGILTFLPQYTYHSGFYPRTDETMGVLPLERGVDPRRATDTHRLFHPLPNVLVLDERADAEAIGNPGLILLVGSRMTPRCLSAVAEKVRDGATCIAMRWLVPPARDLSWKDGAGRWIVVDDLECAVVQEAVRPFLGEPGVWRQRFGDVEVRLYNESGDGITVGHEVGGRR